MEEPKRAFRSSVGGYNKQDVNRYIAELSETYEQSKHELTSRLAELEAERSAPVDAPPSENERRLADELEKANALISEQNTRLDRLGSELEELSSALKAKTEELAAAQEQLAVFADSEEKLKSYDRMSAKLGELMLEAASSADRIKADAEQSARLTILGAEQRERELRESYDLNAAKLDADYRRAVEAIDKKLSEYAAEGMHALSAAMKDTGGELTALLDRRRTAVTEAVRLTSERPVELDALLGESK